MLCVIALGSTLTGCGQFDLSLLVSNTDRAGASSENEANATPSEPEVTAPSVDDPAESADTLASGPSLCIDGTEKRSVLLTGEKASGVWVGDIVEPRGAQYRLRTVLSDDGCLIEGSFEYQGLNCSGTWTPAKVSFLDETATHPQNLQVNFLERVTRNPDNACADVAEVSLLSGPDGIYYSSTWSRSDGTSTSSATKLRRE